MNTIIEYRLRPVTRYIVTRHERSRDGAISASTGSRQIGSEYDNGETAYAVGYALAREEAQRLGYGPGDDRLIYPEDPKIAAALNRGATFGVTATAFDNQQQAAIGLGIQSGARLQSDTDYTSGQSANPYRP